MMTIKATTKPTRKPILSLAFLFAVGATHSAEAFSGVPSLSKTSRIRCIRMVGGDDERISEEEILAMGGDPFFLPDDDESKAK